MKEGVITRKELGRIAEGLLAYLKEHKSQKLSDLEIDLGDEKVATKEHVMVQLRPSNFNTIANVISYVIPGKGIPLECWTNETLNYSRIMLKCESEIPHYVPFTADDFGNIVQYQEMQNSISLSKIKFELEKLVKNAQ